MVYRRLTHVAAVAQTASFTKAAEQMGMTQSGISKSISDLETELGYALFYRTARGALLTDKGRDFAERAGQLLEDTRNLLAGDRAAEDPFARTLRIGVCPASTEWRLARPLGALLARHPSVRFEVIGSGAERLIQLLRSGAVDVAVGYEDAFTEWTDLKRERFAMVTAVLFVRRGHPLLQKAKVSRKDLVAYDCILPSDSRPFNGMLKTLFEAGGVDWQRHLHVTDNVTIARHLVANSDAFALTSREVTRSEGFAEQYEILSGADLDLTLPICCAMRARWDLSPPVKAFLRMMKTVSPERYDLVA